MPGNAEDAKLNSEQDYEWWHTSMIMFDIEVKFTLHRRDLQCRRNETRGENAAANSGLTDACHLRHMHVEDGNLRRALPRAGATAGDGRGSDRRGFVDPVKRPRKR